MTCGNCFCIYWSDNKCILDDITLDIQGNCTSCIYVSIPEKTLEQKRKEVLKKYK